MSNPPHATGVTQPAMSIPSLMELDGKHCTLHVSWKLCAPVDSGKKDRQLVEILEDTKPRSYLLLVNSYPKPEHVVPREVSQVGVNVKRSLWGGRIQRRSSRVWGTGVVVALPSFSQSLQQIVAEREIQRCCEELSAEH